VQELDDGEEFCPICNAINNPGAAELECGHFVALSWESELHWTHPMIDKLIKEIEMIQEIIANYEQIYDTVHKQFYDVFNPDNNSTCDVLSKILPNHQLKYGNSEGGGVSWYLDNISILHETIIRLEDLKQQFNNTINETK
jgi:hypothetical protein